MSAFDLTDVRCAHCRAEKPDQVGLSLPATAERDVLDLGFCSVPCFVLWTKKTFIEAGASPPLAAALVAGPGSPSAAGDRPAACGGAQGRRLLGSAGTVQAPPASNGIESAWA